MTAAELLERTRDCALLDGLAPVAWRDTPSGGRLAITTATVAGRPVLIAALDDGDAAGVFEAMRLAEALGTPSITLTASPWGDALPRPPAAARSPHVLVSAPVTELAGAALAAQLTAHGMLVVAVGDGETDAPVLRATTPEAGLELACLLLGYLPTVVGGELPVYLPVDRPEVDHLAPAAERNAVATAFAVCDDVLRLFPLDTDELVLGIGRVEGRVVAVVAPQTLARPTLSVPALARLADLLGLCARYALPVAVLGTVPRASGDDVVRGVLLRAVASAVAGLRGPVLLVPDDAPASPVHDVIASAPTTVALAASGSRAGIARWIGAAVARQCSREGDATS